MTHRWLRYGLAVVIVGIASWAVPTSAAPVQSNIPDALVDGIMDRLADDTDIHWHDGEYCHITNLYKVVVDAQPWRVEAYANAAWLLWSMDRDTEAVDFLELGLKKNPSTYYMYDELGNYYRIRKKDYTRALPYFEKASHFKDCSAAAIHALALSYDKANEPKKALETWRRAAKMPEGQALAIAKVKALEKKLGLSPGQEP